jgi:hypothetical protein
MSAETPTAKPFQFLADVREPVTLKELRERALRALYCPWL